jgi:membrane protease YdiL (CAAX protease family)
VQSLGKIFLYLFAVLAAAALAAPQAWHLIQSLPGDWMHTMLGGLIGEVQRMPFHRYLSRSIQVAAVMLLWPLLRSLRIRDLRGFGLVRNPCATRDFFTGLAAGVAGVLLLGLTLVVSGVVEWHGLASLAVLPRILLTAAVVAVLEEFLFRGVLLGLCLRFLGPFASILLSSVIFAGVHFFEIPHVDPIAASPRWLSGLDLLLSAGGGASSPGLFVWAFSTLCGAGILLGLITRRTGSLWAAIALHGSWILGQQVFNKASAFHASMLPFAGPAQCHGMVPVGLTPLFSLLVAGVIAALLLRGRERPPREVPASPW